MLAICSETIDESVRDLTHLCLHWWIAQSNTLHPLPHTMIGFSSLTISVATLLTCTEVSALNAPAAASVTATVTDIDPLSQRALTLFGASAFNPALSFEVLQPYWLLLLPLLFQQFLLRVYSRFRFHTWLLPLELFYLVKAKLRVCVWSVDASFPLRQFMHQARVRASELLISKQAARAVRIIAEPKENPQRARELKAIIDQAPELVAQWIEWEQRTDAVRNTTIAADLLLLQRSFAFSKLDFLLVACSAAQLCLQLYSTFSPSSPHRCSISSPAGAAAAGAGPSHWECYNLFGFRLFNFFLPSAFLISFQLSEKFFRKGLAQQKTYMDFNMVRRMADSAEEQSMEEEEETVHRRQLNDSEHTSSIALNINSPLLANDRTLLPTAMVQPWSSPAVAAASSSDTLPSFWVVPSYRDSFLPVTSMVLLLPAFPFLFTNVLPMVVAYGWLLGWPLAALDKLGDVVKTGGGMDGAEKEWQEGEKWKPLMEAQQQRLLSRALIYIICFTFLASILVPLLAALTFNYSNFLLWGENYLSVLSAEWQIHSTHLFFESLQQSSERLWRCLLQI